MRITFLAVVVMFAMLGGLVLMPAPALAKPPDCDEDASGNEEPDKLKACERKLNDEQFFLLDEFNLLIDEVEKTQGLNRAALYVINAQNGQALDIREHMAKLGRQQKHADDAITESEKEEYEEMVAQGGKEKGKNCILEETQDVQDFPNDYLPPGTNAWRAWGGDELGDGACNRFEAFDEDKQKWVKFQERSQPNICVRVCGDKDLPPGQAGKKKEKLRNRHVERKSEALDATKKATDAVAQARQDLMMMNVMSETLGPREAMAAAFPECDLPPDVPHIATWGTKVVLTGVKAVALIASGVLETVEEVADDGVKQTAAGFNASAANIPAVVAKMIAKGIVEATDILIDAADLTNEGFEIFTADAGLECARSIRQKQAEMIGMINGISGIVNGIDSKVDDLLIKAGNTERALADLTTLVQENREYIKNNRGLLLNPHGQRKNYPLYEAPPLPAR
jgi:hypothetical protein